MDNGIQRKITGSRVNNRQNQHLINAHKTQSIKDQTISMQKTAVELKVDHKTRISVHNNPSLKSYIRTSPHRIHEGQEAGKMKRKYSGS